MRLPQLSGTGPSLTLTVNPAPFSNPNPDPKLILHRYWTVSAREAAARELTVGVGEQGSEDDLLPDEAGSSQSQENAPHHAQVARAVPQLAALASWGCCI